MFFAPAETMRKQISASMLLSAAGCVSAASDCSPSTEEAPAGSRFSLALVDRQRAEESRRHHSEASFHRYGENGTISSDGSKRSSRSVGLDRIKNITVKHREQAGHHHHHPHGDHHHHPHPHHHGHSNGAGSQNRTEDSDRHRVSPTASAASGREVRTTSVGKIHKRSSDGASPASVATATTVKHEPEDDHNEEHSEREECSNASGLLFSHGMSRERGVASGDFAYSCPALLNQIDSGACLFHGNASPHEETVHKHNQHSHGHHGDHGHGDHGHDDHDDHNHGGHDDHNHDDHNHDAHGHGDHDDHRHAPYNHSSHGGGENGRNIAAAWVGGFVSITVISMSSSLGVVLIPLMNRVFFKFLLSFSVASAVGTSSGDAFSHLIPHSQGGHHHHHHGEQSGDPHLHDEEDGENSDGVLKGSTASGGVYFMFSIEHFSTSGKMYKDKKQKVQKKWDQNNKSDPEKQPASEESESKPTEDVETNGAVAEEEQVMSTPQVSVVSPQSYGRPQGGAGYSSEDCENKCHSHFHDTVGQADSMHHHHHDYHHISHHHHSQNHHPHSHAHSYSEQHFQQAGVATSAWMVIMGDGSHNFSDGSAIGAAFTESSSSGLSTSVAVFCHELPHELGDFAVSSKAGMTVRQAILYNVSSAMMAYLGMVTGISIGHYAENICMWIFALTAGLFMYVASVDMVPEMSHNDAGDHGFSHWGFFFSQNAGISSGFCIMSLIASFEHKIQSDSGD